MPLDEKSVTLHGSCHCGNLGVEFRTDLEPAAIHPRACDCSFCRKHGAAYISDPAGTLHLTVADPDAVLTYRQGSGAARFKLCGRCGVLIAVVFEHDGRTRGAVNAGCLDDEVELGTVVSVSPQLLDPSAKVERWLQAWVPDVQWVIAGG